MRGAGIVVNDYYYDFYYSTTIIIDMEIDAKMHRYSFNSKVYV